VALVIAGGLDELVDDEAFGHVGGVAHARSITSRRRDAGELLGVDLAEQSTAATLDAIGDVDLEGTLLRRVGSFCMALVRASGPGAKRVKHSTRAMPVSARYGPANAFHFTPPQGFARKL